MRTPELDGVNKKLLKDVLKNRDLIENDNWGIVQEQVRPSSL